MSTELTEELKQRTIDLAKNMVGDVMVIPDSDGMVLVRTGTEEHEKRRKKIFQFPAPVEGFVICTK